MLKRHLLWASFAATLALAACGGDGDTTADSDSGGTDTASPTPAPAPASQFIEPLDTAGKSVATKAESAAASRLPAQAEVAQVALGPLPASTAAKSSAVADKNAPLKIGESRTVAATATSATLGSRLNWNTLADGTQVAAVAFTAEGAKGLRLGVRVDALPAGAVLRFYSSSEGQVSEVTAAQISAQRQASAAAGLDQADARMIWGPDTSGATSVLEVQLPAGASPAQAQLAVPQLSHLTTTVADIATGKAAGDIGSSGSCNLDVMCSAYQSEGRSVARMTFVDGGSTYLCTGTLMNDTQNSRTPYFLTANHCVDTQAAASTLNTYWFYRAASCGSSQLDSAATVRTGGADLLYSNATIDATLLRLKDSAPANVLYAGSYYGSVASGTGTLGVHHPMGDLQKYSIGSVAGFGICTTASNGDISCGSASETSATKLQISWSSGTTEGGSSGSAIFAQSGDTRYVVGTLTGGTASCTYRNGSDYYARFQNAFSDGIQKWLAP